jgi:hypothetical protein
MKILNLLSCFLLILGSCISKNEDPEIKLIIQSGQSTFQEELATKELRRYIYLRTGAQSEIIKYELNPGQNADIILGVKDQLHIKPYLNETGLSGIIEDLEPQQYIIKTVKIGSENVLLIVGGDQMGMLYGTYSFIENLGIRFYLEGDVIPDQKIIWEKPDIYKIGKPIFELRGLNPWGSHPFGFDQWNADDYKAIIGQMTKMRMNFIGMHCYLTHPYDEPTVWVGEKEDINSDGTVKTAYPARYYNTLWRGIWGPILNRKTSEYPFGASLLFETDSWGPESMEDFCPTPYSPENQNELFNRVGKQFNDAFSFARLMGVKTCLGTEAPLKKFVPEEIKRRLTARGKDPADNATIEDLYMGIFERIKRTHPLDYYWIWTPEDWTWRPNSIDDMYQTVEDINIAYRVLKDVNATFKLATSGWVLGPVGNRAAFDVVIPKDIPMSALSQNVGHISIDTAYKNIKNRDKWAIPWLESDSYQGLAALQLFAGRTMFDAIVAKKYECTGLMGLLWRTRELGPNVSALANTAWDSSLYSQFNSIDYTQDHFTGSWHLSSRTVPVLNFYKDFALASFGAEVSEQIAEIFSSLDGKVPISVKSGCPSGSLSPDTIAWEKVAINYNFVEEMEMLRPEVKGAGNLERFDFWLNTFRYHKNLAKVRCTLGTFEIAMKNVGTKRGFENRKDCAKSEVLPIFFKLVGEYEELLSLCMNSVTTNSGIATIVNLMQHQGFWHMAIEDPGKRLSDLLGGTLPPEALPTNDYKGESRMFMTTIRTSILEGESLDVKVNLLSNSKPSKITMFWKTLGGKKYSEIPLTNMSRGIFTTTLISDRIAGKDFEYFIEAEFDKGNSIVYPATAEEINNTVIVLDH